MFCYLLPYCSVTIDWSIKQLLSNDIKKALVFCYGWQAIVDGEAWGKSENTKKRFGVYWSLAYSFLCYNGPCFIENHCEEHLRAACGICISSVISIRNKSLASCWIPCLPEACIKNIGLTIFFCIISHVSPCLTVPTINSDKILITQAVCRFVRSGKPLNSVGLLSGIV